MCGLRFILKNRKKFHFKLLNFLKIVRKLRYFSKEREWHIAIISPLASIVGGLWVRKLWNLDFSSRNKFQYFHHLKPQTKFDSRQTKINKNSIWNSASKNNWTLWNKRSSKKRKKESERLWAQKGNNNKDTFQEETLYSLAPPRHLLSLSVSKKIEFFHYHNRCCWY